MDRRFDVYGIGNALIDLQFQVPEEMINELELEKGGMCLVGDAEQAVLLELLGSREVHRACGGSAANTMIAIAQLGGRAAYGCLVGDDTYGEFYREEMEVLGITLHNAPIPRRASGSCVILITPDAERTMNTALGASASFGPEHVSEELIAQSRWVYIEGYLLSSELGQAAVRRAVDCAKRHQTHIALTFSDGFIVDLFREPLAQCVEEADFIFANVNEARRFTGATDDDSTFMILKTCAPNGAMTMSEKGARIWFHGAEGAIAPYPVKAIDDTGAGDMFAGAFLYGITHGESAFSAGELACFLASRVVAQLGPRLRGDVRELVRDFTALRRGER